MIGDLSADQLRKENEQLRKELKEKEKHIEEFEKKFKNVTSDKTWSSQFSSNSKQYDDEIKKKNDTI